MGYVFSKRTVASLNNSGGGYSTRGHTCTSVCTYIYSTVYSAAVPSFFVRKLDSASSCPVGYCKNSTLNEAKLLT